MDSFSQKKSEQLLKILTCPEQNYKPIFDSEEQAKEAFYMLVHGLEEYHKSNTAQIRSLINQAEILLEKDLNSQAEKVLAKAYKMAAKEKDTELLSEVLEYQLIIYSMKAPTPSNLKVVETYFADMEENLKQQAKKFDITL